MSILIKDIFGKERPMPQEGYIDVRLHFRGGRIECATTQTGNPPFYATFKVVEIPTPHERLIDADKLMMSLADWWYSSFGQEETDEAKAIRAVMQQMEKSIDEMTVIEAEGSK